MKILISNDDGILANGIRALIEALAPCHDVYVVAPDRERSAAGHSLTLHTPIRVEEVEPKYGAKRCWMTSGTPGDCVKMAITAILAEDEKPDLVISGLNHGPNLGIDIIYSGTVNCALEGAMLGYPSIATSLTTMRNDYEDFKVAAEFVAEMVQKLDAYNLSRWKFSITTVIFLFCYIWHMTYLLMFCAIQQIRHSYYHRYPNHQYRYQHHQLICSLLL